VKTPEFQAQDCEAARRVLTLAASWRHDWLNPFIPELSDGYSRLGYEWLWDELTKLERQYEHPMAAAGH